MSKKVGILTLYYKNRNYGGLLQAYALQKFLTEEGIDSEQISFSFAIDDRSNYLGGFWKNPPIKKVKQLYHYLHHKAIVAAKKLLSLPYQKRLKKRIEAFENFQNRIPHSEYIYRTETIKESTDWYNIYICGSDVIWNAGIAPEVSCLGFAKNQKRIAYAPSIGKGDPPHWWLESYGPYLKRLDAVSVREDSVRKGIKKRFPELTITTVLDPVFLLSDDIWDKMLNVAEVTRKVSGSKQLSEANGGYLFCYLLGSSVVQREEVTKLAKKWNKRIVSFPFAEDHMFRKCDKKFGDEKQYEAGPEDFLNILRNADVVVTDSFHAIAFSLIFHRPFWAVDRKEKEETTGLNGRILNLLLEVGMKDRYCDDVHIADIPLEKELDYKQFDIDFSIKREESRRYLLENLLE